jgi:hypothetical protein
MSHSYFVPHLEKHAQYTCLRIAEAFTTEFELSDRWVVGLELGNWDATELLQRLALLLSNMTLPNGSTDLSITVKVKYHLQLPLEPAWPLLLQ